MTVERFGDKVVYMGPSELGKQQLAPPPFCCQKVSREVAVPWEFQALLEKLENQFGIILLTLAARNDAVMLDSLVSERVRSARRQLGPRSARFPSSMCNAALRNLAQPRSRLASMRAFIAT